ncbi:MAG: excisionase family DNA-binding protein [Candidatus Hodarchaeota archaeon]
MKHYVAIGEASFRLRVCRTTIRRWDADGKIRCYRTPGVHRRIAFVEIERILSEGLKEECEGIDCLETLKEPKATIYARVSSHDQK